MIGAWAYRHSMLVQSEEYKYRAPVASNLTWFMATAHACTGSRSWRLGILIQKRLEVGSLKPDGRSGD